MQLRTLLLIKQCYNLMKLVDVLPKFQFLICATPERRGGRGLNTEHYIISA